MMKIELRAAWDHLSQFRYYQKRALVPSLVIRDMQLIIKGADAVILEAVKGMRIDGASWAEVGDALGVSAQAAHRRYRTVTK